MVDGFLVGLNQHLLFWSGWVFTVGGAVAGLLIGKEYGWLGGLGALVGLSALTTFAWEKHKQLREATKNHQTSVHQLTEDVQAVTRRAEEAERRLNAIPANILARLQAVIEAHSLADLARLLADYASYVERMKILTAVNPKPIRLRVFVKRAGDLYAVAGLDQSALVHLQDDDPFLLEFKDPNGLITRSATLLLHQTEPAKEVVWFRVDRMFGDEMAHLDALAEKQEVPARGYSVRPACDPNQYAGLNLAGVADVIRRLVEEIARNRS